MNNMTTVREMNVYYSAALSSKALEWNDESKALSFSFLQSRG